MSDAGASPPGPLVRIGELARRVGIPAATLRAWERRYGVLDPQRGGSGYRLYSPRDEQTLRAMVALIAEGLAPAEAAQRVLTRGGSEPSRSADPPDASMIGPIREALLAALIGFDEAAASNELDRATAALSVEAFIGEVVLPVLREIGDRWAREEITIGQEHFASAVVRGRLLALARGWGGGDGSLALLACPSGEQHDLGVICFGLMLRTHGWRIAFLGGDTPVESIRDAVVETRPDVVVVFAMFSEPLEGIEPILREIAEGSPLLLAGPGTDPARGERIGAAMLEGGPIEAAALLAS